MLGDLAPDQPFPDLPQAGLRRRVHRRLGPADMLDVGAGLFGVVVPVPGPVIQRYSGAPWPVAGF